MTQTEKYDEYKNSWIEWIGKIPKDWEIIRLKNVLKERNEKNRSIKTKKILSLTKNRGVIPYSEKGNIGNKSKDNLEKYKLAYPNDIVVNSMNVIIGSVGLSEYFGALSPVYYTLYIRNKNDNINYFNYIFQVEGFQKFLAGYGNWILSHRMRIPMINLNDVSVPYAKPREQQKIASYLDSKTSKIDSLIEKKKKMIQNLKEYKKSLITQAVTKGKLGDKYLNSDGELVDEIEMKDSWIEWIGEVPENWGISKLKYVSKVKMGSSPPSKGYNSQGNGSPFLQWNAEFSNIHPQPKKYCNNASKFSKKEDILISVRAPVGELNISDQIYAIGRGLCAISAEQNLNKLYLWFLLKAFRKELFMLSTGSTYDSVSSDDLKNITILFPMLENQQKIASYLDAKTSKIDKSIEKIEKSIDLLEEYKTSLISHVVTGKVKVV